MTIERMKRPLAVFLVCSALAVGGERLRFRVTLDPALSAKPMSGRLLVFLSDREQKAERLSTGFSPGAVWVSAMEVDALEPGKPLTFDPDREAFPKPFSEAPKGKLQFMALLDPDHTYSYHGSDAGDVTSPVVQLEIDPADNAGVDLTLSQVSKGRPAAADTESIKLEEMASPRLGAFWGREIKVRGGVVLPPSYGKDETRRYATVYVIHGFGGDHTGAWRAGGRLQTQMQEGKLPEMIYVYLDASFSTGHHVFADSVNNGPWGAALTREFIPFLESKYRMAGARFLTGHSSGGWSTLWLQVAYPDVFHGTWSTAPDPVDFRSFTGIDASALSGDNAYRNADGSKKMLVRRGTEFVTSFEDFTKQEEVTGPVGGQIASFEWVFSPRGRDGRPMRLFNRVTGETDAEVRKAWEKYDIRLVLERNWETLGPKLRGRLHIICGELDTFRLEEAVRYLCGMLASKGREDACELVPERNHGNLYQAYKTFPDGLQIRIAKEMQAAFEAMGGK